MAAVAAPSTVAVVVVTPSAVAPVATAEPAESPVDNAPEARAPIRLQSQPMLPFLRVLYHLQRWSSP